MEKWIDIKGYEGIYQISDKGRVKSFRCGKEKIMKPTARKADGRLALSLRKNNMPEYFKVHQLVGNHFLEKTKEKNEINHIDGNFINNNFENLEWCTRKENMNHAFKTGLTVIGLPGESNPNAKLTANEVREIRKLYKKEKMHHLELAEMFGVSRSSVRQIIQKKTWKNID